MGDARARPQEVDRSRRCRRWPARTAARSRSSSRGGTGAAGDRWGRSRTARRPGPSARARASAVRGRSGSARSPPRGPSAPPGMRRSAVPWRARRRPARRPTRRARPRRPARARRRRRRAWMCSARAMSTTANRPAAASSAPSATVLRVDERDDEQRDDVVDHDHREQEGAQAIEPARADERKHAQREGRVGRHGRPPAALPNRGRR